LWRGPRTDSDVSRLPHANRDGAGNWIRAPTALRSGGILEEIHCGVQPAAETVCGDFIATSDAARKLQGWFRTTLVAGSMRVEDSGDWMTLRAEFEAESEARFIVLGFGSRVRVVAPKELQQWVQMEAHAMTGQKLAHAAED